MVLMGFLPVHNTIGLNSAELDLFQVKIDALGRYRWALRRSPERYYCRGFFGSRKGFAGNL
jgi:hypothetical protein